MVIVAVFEPSVFQSPTTHGPKPPALPTGFA